MLETAIKLTKKAGGSIIDHKPLFSNNSKVLYVGCGPILRLFSTDTGEHIQDVEIGAISLDKPEGSIVDICRHPFDKNVVILCFEEGRIISWSFETNTVVYNIVLNVENERVVRMKLHVVSEDLETFDVIVGVKHRDANDIKLCILSYATGSLKHVIQKRFDFLMHSWSVTDRGGKDFLAGISSNALIIFNLKTNKLNRDILIGNDRYFTCVVCHPVDECVAVGDNTGRVILYHDFLNATTKSNCPHYVFHWHTLPVNDIVFTQSGSLFYSGGNEHVLVKWTVDAPDVRHFLPRLSAPIVHLEMSRDNQFIAVSTLDNAILIVNAQQKIHCTVQQFTWGFISVPGQKLFPCGLVIDSRSNCIVMNGKPGHIQFFSPQYSSLIYNMDVVGQNYLSQERSKSIINADVVAVQFSSDGTWLTTVQLRADPDFKSDTLLKFWLFNRTSQTYKLNSCVTLQHHVRKILFQPVTEQDKHEDEVEYMVATLCSDNKFRLWINNSIKGKTAVWNCHSIGYYRDHPLLDICFSSDSSLLGAAFGPCLTLWDTDTNEMKCSLTKGSEPLRQIVFGHENNSFIAVTATSSTLYAWNLLSLTLAWSLKLDTSFLVADPRSEYIAAFTVDSSLFVFKASSSNCVYQQDKVCENNAEVLSATFFPMPRGMETESANASVQWLCNSSLYFFTSAQELMAFECRGRELRFDSLPFISEKSAPTPFKALVASESSSAVPRLEVQSYLQLGVSWSQTVSQFINSPAHAMPSMHLLCEPLLRSLVISRPLEDPIEN